MHSILYMTRIDGSNSPQLYRLKQVTAGMEQLTLRLSTGRRISGPNDHPRDWREISTSRERLSALSTMNDAMSGLAVSLREVSHTIEAVARHLVDLQSEYEAIVTCGKPPGTTVLMEEQRLHVSKFNEILRQIDLITNDNAGDLPRMLLGDDSQPGNGDLRVVVDEAGGTRTIQRQGLYSGVGGLNLSSISFPPDYVQLTEMADRLVAAKITLETRRQSFDWDTAALSRAIQDNESKAARLVQHVDDLQAVDDQETAVALLTLQVAQSLMVNSERLVFDLKSSLLELLG